MTARTFGAAGYRTATRLAELDGTVGPLDSFQWSDVQGRNLRAGMLIVDRELGTPELALDHRVKAPHRGTGSAWWLCESWEGARYQTVPFHLNARYAVAVAPMV